MSDQLPKSNRYNVFGAGMGKEGYATFLREQHIAYFGQDAANSAFLGIGSHYGRGLDVGEDIGRAVLDLPANDQNNFRAALTEVTDWFLQNPQGEKRAEIALLGNLQSIAITLHLTAVTERIENEAYKKVCAGREENSGYTRLLDIQKLVALSKS